MYRRVALVLIAAGWGANHFAAMLIVYRRDLGLAASSLGLLFAAYAIGLVPGLFLAGRTSDARGRRTLVLPASCLAIVASAVLAFGAHGFAVIFCGRLLYGLAMGCAMSPGSVWVQELSTPETGPRRATLALSAGFGVGPLAAGVVAEFLPWPMVLPFLVHIAVMAVAILGARGVPETAVRALRAESTAAETRATAPSNGLGRQELTVLARLLPVAPWTFGFAAITSAILPGLLRSHVSRPILYSGFVVAATLFAGVAVQSYVSRLGRAADLVGMVIGAAGIYVAALSVTHVSPGLVFVSGILAGAGYGLVMTSGLREVSESASRETRGTAVGIYYVLAYLGFALPFLHAIAAKTVGDAETFRITCYAALACLAVRVLVKPKRRPVLAA